MVITRTLSVLLAFSFVPHLCAQDDLGALWGSAREEAKYYPIVNVPIPPQIPMRPGGFEILPDGRLAVGTRRGDIYFIKGAFDSPPKPEYQLFATGQDELFSLAWKDGAMTAVSFGEATRISDADASNGVHPTELAKVEPSVFAFGMVVAPHPGIAKPAGKVGYIPLAAAFEDEDLLPTLGQPAGRHGPAESTSDDDRVVGHRGSPPNISSTGRS